MYSFVLKGSLRGRRSKGKGKGIRARDHATPVTQASLRGKLQHVDLNLIYIVH